MTLRLDNIAAVSPDKLDLLRAFGEPTSAPAFIARVAPKPKRDPEQFPRADRIAEARAMLRNGATNEEVIAKIGLSLPQVASLRSHIERRY